MPTGVSDWLQLVLLVVWVASLLLAVLCLLLPAVGWKWRVLAGCGALVCFAAIVGFDLWHNSVARFPSGPFPRGRLFYLIAPALAVSCMGRGIVAAVQARHKVTPSESTFPSASARKPNGDIPDIRDSADAQ
jgi:hypothetical protein